MSTPQIENETMSDLLDRREWEADQFAKTPTGKRDLAQMRKVRIYEDGELISPWEPIRKVNDDYILQPGRFNFRQQSVARGIVHALPEGVRSAWSGAKPEDSYVGPVLVSSDRKQLEEIMATGIRREDTEDSLRYLRARSREAKWAREHHGVPMPSKTSSEIIATSDNPWLDTVILPQKRSVLEKIIPKDRCFCSRCVRREHNLWQIKTKR